MDNTSMAYTKILQSLVLFCLLVSFVACSNQNNTEQSQNSSDNQQITNDSTSSDEPIEVNYSLPSPLQVAAIFKKSGLPYKEGVTSQKKDPSIYVSNVARAVNLGVYSADMSYNLLNKKNQEAMEYMKLSRQIAEKLGMGGVYEANGFAGRFEKNVANEDSLISLVSELQMEMDFYIDESSQKQITAIAFAGAWVECIYLAAEVNRKSGDETINRRFSEQMNMLESIITALELWERMDGTIKTLLAQMKHIKEVYVAQESVKKALSNKEYDGEVIELTTQEIITVSLEVADLRFKFINGEL